MSAAGPVVVKIEGLADGQSSPFDGEFLVEYDPERDGEAPDGRSMICHVVTSSDLADARRFPDFTEAAECWKRVCERKPTRPDGQPNRPLTAFSVAILPEEKCK